MFSAAWHFLLLAALLSAPESALVAAAAGATARPRPRLLLSDEFNGIRLDRRKWEPQIGNGCQYSVSGWGNAERQWYSDLPSNLRVRKGRLVLQAQHRPDAPQPFTSARIRTFTKFSVAPSLRFPTIRVEARIKVPQGLGLWPAFWLLPEDASYSCSGCGRYGGWASSGEIDVMEIANDAKTVKGTIHYGGMWPNNVSNGSAGTLPDGRPYSDSYHVYRLDWQKDEMRWYVDNRLFFRARSSSGSKEQGWYSLAPCSGEACATAPARPGNAPFDRRFHLILNLALGSEGTGFTKQNGVGITEQQLKETLQQPKAMLVDWVRVWGMPAAGTGR